MKERPVDDGYEFTFEDNRATYVCLVFKNCDLRFKTLGLDRYINTKKRPE